MDQANSRQSEMNEGEAKAGTLVLGLGNTLRGDDGLGVRAIEALEQMNLPGEVRVDEGGTGGITILQMMEGFRRVIIVDTVDAGLPPGSIVKTMVTEDQLAGENVETSLHSAGLATAFQLGAALGGLPPIALIGVQGRDFGWGSGLSEPVAAALPAVIEMVLEEIGHEASH